MKKTLYILLVLIFLTAQAKILPISANKAVEIALENNLEFQAKKKEIDIQKQEIKIANQLKNPEIASNFLMGKVTRGNSSQIGLTLPIEILKRGTRKQAEIAKLKVLTDELDAYEHKLKIKVLKSYFNVLYAKSVLQVYKDRAQRYSMMQIISQQKNENNEDKTDILQSDIKRRKQLVEINKVRAQVKIAQFNFNDVLNLKDTSIIYDTQEESLFDDNIEILNIDLPDYTAIEEIALKFSYSLKIADSQINLANKNLKIEEHKKIPDIAISAGPAWQTARQTKIDALPGSFIGIWTEIPLLNQFKSNVEKAKIEIEKTKTNKDSYESHLKYALKENFNRFNYARENLEHYKNILTDSNQILDIYTKKYQEDKVTILNILQVEQAHINTIGDYLNAINVFFSSYLDLMENVGHDILLNDEIL